MPKLENKYEKIVWEMNMIKNIIFDIGNVILNFNIKEVLQKFTNNKIELKIIMILFKVFIWNNEHSLIMNFIVWFWIYMYFIIII